MEMPFTDNQGIHIYYKVEGHGTPLILLHPFSGNLEDYYELGFVDKLQDTYRLILIDSRGHGQSDKPHDPNAYLMDRRVSDVVAVLDDLSIDKAHFFGYSMGGRIGFAITKYAADRFYSLIIGGAQPFNREASDEIHPWIPLLRQGIEVGIEHYVKLRGDRISPERKARLMTNDPEALIAMLSVNNTLDLKPDLPNMSIPCLVYAGKASDEHKAAKRAVSKMPNADFVSLPGLDHYDGLRRSDLALPLVTKFLSEVSAAL